MGKFEPLPEFINGFKIVEDLGAQGAERRKCIAICKRCGFVFTTRTDTIKVMKSCRCYQNYPARLAWISDNMIRRCDPKNADKYKYHAGKSIKVCNEWQQDRVRFCEWSMANGYGDTKTIDRINSKLDYEPTNCRWVTMQEQAQNNSNKILNETLVIAMRKSSKEMSCADVARLYGVDKTTAWQAIRGITWSNVQG